MQQIKEKDRRPLRLETRILPVTVSIDYLSGKSNSRRGSRFYKEFVNSLYNSIEPLRV